MSWYRAQKIWRIALLLALTLSVTGCRDCRKLKFWNPNKGQAPVMPDLTPIEPPEPPIYDPTARSPVDVEPLPGDQTDYVDIGEMGDPFALPEEKRPPVGADPFMLEELPTIHFAFDSDKVRSEDWAKLGQIAQWLMDHPEVMVQIEGHCDERGTPEYNLSLGQRRANSVREYLASRGVDPNRLITISYGEERPLRLERTEEAYAENRRVQFMVYE